MVIAVRRDLSSRGEWRTGDRKRRAGFLDGPARRNPVNLASMSQPDLVELKEQVYKDPRPAEHFARFHERTRTHRPNYMYELVRIVMSLIAWIFFRAGNRNPERVPDVGPVILAPNHFSFLDHFFLGTPLRRKVHFMAKSQLFKPPMEKVYSPGGVFPVRRGFADEEAFSTAVTILDRGDVMAMYAEGGRSRTGGALVQAAARDRPAGVAERGADRPGGDHRLRARAQLEAPAVPEGPRLLRPSVPL